MPGKIIARSQLKSLCERLRRQRKKIVFTNGTFDIIHLGHVTYLQKARKFGDLLIVGVNSDASVKSYKTPDRPINSENDRMAVTMKQIAGFIARRISCTVKTGDAINDRRRIGMIQFGSQVAVYLPGDVSISVRKGQFVTPGQGLAEFKN